MLPVLIRSDDRADQDHRGASGSREARQYHASEHDDRIKRGRCANFAANIDAARDDVQRTDQCDEGDVFEDKHMDEFMKSGAGSEKGGERRQKSEPPEQRHQAVVAMPETGCGRWQNRERAQDFRERQHPKEAQLGAVDCSVRGGTGGAGR